MGDSLFNAGRDRDVAKRTCRSDGLRLEFRLVQSAQFTVGRATQSAVAVGLFAMAFALQNSALVYPYIQN